MKTLKKVLLGILILVGAFVVLLVGSVIVDSVFGANRLDKVTNVTIPGTSGGPDVRAYVAKPEGDGPFPAVIMIHEFFGLNESIVSKADLLAKEGYLVVAPDTFRGSTTSWIPRAIYQVITTKPEAINADLDSVYAWLESQPEVDPARVATAGFCYGGRASLAYSLHNPKLAATVIFYGSPETDPAVLKTLPGPVLGIFGGILIGAWLDRKLGTGNKFAILFLLVGTFAGFRSLYVWIKTTFEDSYEEPVIRRLKDEPHRKRPPAKKN